MMLSTIFTIMILFPSNLVASAQPQRKQQETTCSWGGQIFQRGQSLGSSFVTRCGSYEEYPCYCNPDMNPPIECPYCSFAVKSESSSASSDLLCAGDGEIVSFMDVTGIEKTCECSASPGETPTPNCDLQNPDNGGGDTTSTCTIDLPDGTSRVFNAGESIEDFLPNRCGTDFPCFCNPNIEGQIECPYCRFTTLGGNGLTCARNGESVFFQDLTGVAQTCSCQIPDGTETPVVNCSIDDDEDDGTSPSPTPSPTPPLSNEPQTDICTLELPTGQTITFQNGESYGDYLPPTRCGSTADFPCYCNPAFPNQIECPYCGFVHGNNDESITCSKDGETISFQDEADSVTRTCTCEIPDDPSLEPIQNCGIGTLPPTSAPIFTPPPLEPTPEPTPPTDNENVCTVLDLVSGGAEEVIIPDGESLGDHFEGACGNAAFWPAFCNAESSNNDEQGSDSKVSRQRAGVGATARSVVVVGDVVYPYCIFEDALDGSTVCARSNGDVTYVNNNKIEVTCDCLYLSPALGGAQSNCRETNGSSETTTDPPAESPDGEQEEVENSKSSSPNQSTALSIWSTTVILAAVAVGTVF